MSDQDVTAFHFRQVLYSLFRSALSNDQTSAKVDAQDLHDKVVLEPNHIQKMSLCCEVMRSVFNSQGGDVLVKDAEPGRENQLTIQYIIPRPEWGSTWR
jgi:Mor family transcriptional regulator